MTVRIAKDGIHYPKDGASVEDGHVLLRHWYHSVCVDKDVTLADIVRILKGYDQGTLSIVEELCGTPFLNFFGEIDEDAEPDCNLSHIRVYKTYNTLDMLAYGGDIEIQDYVRCNGVGKESDGRHEAWALDFMPWSKIRDLPIVLDNHAELWIDHNGKCDKPFGTFLVEISFGEFIYALFDELAFFGSPERRAANHEKLQRSIDSIREGQMKCTPWEELRERVEETIAKAEDKK